MFVVWVWKDSSLELFRRWLYQSSTSRLKGGWPRLLISPVSPTPRVPRPSRSLRGAGTTNACATGIVRKGQRLASAASYPPLQRTQEPALSKVEGTGHPQQDGANKNPPSKGGLRLPLLQNQGPRVAHTTRCSLCG